MNTNEHEVLEDAVAERFLKWIPWVRLAMWIAALAWGMLLVALEPEGLDLGSLNWSRDAWWCAAIALTFPGFIVIYTVHNRLERREIGLEPLKCAYEFSEIMKLMSEIPEVAAFVVPAIANNRTLRERDYMAAKRLQWRKSFEVEARKKAEQEAEERAAVERLKTELKQAALAQSNAGIKSVSLSG